MTPWYEVAAGLWTETAVLIVAVLGVWAVLVRPFQRSYPALSRLAEHGLAALFIAGFVAVFAVRYAQAV